VAGVQETNQEHLALASSVVVVVVVTTEVVIPSDPLGQQVPGTFLEQEVEIDLVEAVDHLPVVRVNPSRIDQKVEKEEEELHLYY
jgi:hypothetical protein